METRVARTENKKKESWQKNFFKFVGGAALDIAMHAITATQEFQARHTVFVRRLTEHRLVIEDRGKLESIPVVFRSIDHFKLLTEALVKGKKVNIALDCIVSFPNTEPTIIKAEIVGAQICA